MTIKQQHAAITGKYLEGKTLQEFATAIGRTRQEVHMWRHGVQQVPAVFLYRLAFSADGWVYDWAQECLKVYLLEE